ncbi:virulence RhuM family protein [Wolinella succinogenes]|uniref:virulence RhuM family protein n=1 Tax=Wolinella succinogenes TaxID=844 RepID=UPI002FC727DC
MDKQLQTTAQEFSNFVIFKIDNSKVNIDVLFQDETLWLTQKKMAELFETTPQNITLHLKNIYNEQEQDESATCKEFLQVQKEGSREVKRLSKYYNLKAIVAVGYRVNSHRAIEFRKWATAILEEYIIKGFAMDDERLKQIKHFGKDYFDEQLERIREIRASERRFYQKITDIYALSADSVQNKMHWAMCGKTAAEIIYSEADAEKIYMGLKTWKNAPDGKILKSDVTIAKNYLNEEHIKKLDRIVVAYLELAEIRASQGIVMNMKDWIMFLDKFLALSDYPILLDNGKVSALEAKLKAEAEYENYRVVQDRLFVSDFDKLLLEMGKDDE